MADLIQFEVTEAERQLLLLALAKLSIERPGWDESAISPVAKKLKGEEMFKLFKRQNIKANG